MNTEKFDFLTMTLCIEARSRVSVLADGDYCVTKPWNDLLGQELFALFSRKNAFVGIITVTKFNMNG